MILVMNINDIKEIEFELTSRCNAACPLCPRSEPSFTKILNHKREITVDKLQSWIPKAVFKNLQLIELRGAVSDPLMSHHFTEIVTFLKSVTNCKLQIHTNGSLRTTQFWSSLAKLLPEKHEIVFGIDGLEDTHSLYRVNTSYHKVLENAQAFINAGGIAIWQIIKFPHNEHQIEDCEKLSKQMGFAQFYVLDNDRYVDNYRDNTSNWIKKSSIDIQTAKVRCGSLKRKQIFINWDGEVFPCCMFGIFANKTKKDFNFISWKKIYLQNDTTKNNLNYFTLDEVLNNLDNLYSEVEINSKINLCYKYCNYN